MAIGFFRKLKDFGKKVWGGVKKVTKKLLPIVEPIVKPAVQTIAPAVAPFIDPALQLIKEKTGLSKPPDKNNDYLQLKKAI